MSRDLTVAQLDSVKRVYDERDGRVFGLKSASLTVSAGERVSVCGPSGSGKSTLLNILGLLDQPDAGQYRLLGTDYNDPDCPESDRDFARRSLLGVVFQAYHVLGNRTLAENLDLRLSACRTPRRERIQRISETLEIVGLSGMSSRLAGTLSGGEKQRLAIARAIAVHPRLLLADEPTGNLDDTNTAAVLQALDTSARAGVAVLVITHDAAVASWADVRCDLLDGTLA